MGEILKKSFAAINSNFWLLFLFMTVCYLGIVYFGILQASVNKPIEIIVGLVTLFFITVAGVAGIFNTIKLTLDAHNNKIDIAKMELLKSFPKGVSEYFFSAFGLVILYLFISFIYFGIFYTVGDIFIGKFSFSLDTLANSLSSPEAMVAFQNTLTPEDYSKLSKWYLLYFVSSSILTYCLLYWLPEMFYCTKNSLFALVKAVVKAVLHPIKTVILFFILMLINFCTSLIVMFVSAVPVLNILVYFIYFYSLLLTLIFIFNYYKFNFCDNLRSQEVINNDKNIAEDDTDDKQ